MTIELIPLDKHWAREVANEGNASLAAACSNFDTISSELEEAVDAHVALYERTGASAPWVAYLARIVATREFVGICSFKDAPRDGRVEVAFFTFPPYRHRGFGGAMAVQLVDLAFKDPNLMEVISHTTGRESASTRILQALNFSHVGRVRDSEGGVAWRWSLRRGQRLPKRHRFVPLTTASALFAFVARGSG